MTTLPTRHTWTVDDLDTMPDDGNRYELLDGLLVVTPAPSRRHQRISMRLGSALHALCPAGLEVLAAPFDVRLAPDTSLQPDVLVASMDELTERGLPTAPLLAVEILSPSTRLYDLNLKKARYEEAGCASYWVVDPGTDATPPSITAWDLQDGLFVEVGAAEGEQTLSVSRPFPITLSPAGLVGDQARRG
ncbi:Uma2 family endonuclease [Mobilicoccus caccae]|nr:Uma2 family endonuclease [Mobilicoccus caccae]